MSINMDFLCKTRVKHDNEKVPLSLQSRPNFVIPWTNLSRHVETYLRFDPP